MFRDVVTELRIEGMRTIEALRLPLRGLTVLIGDNGGGKSSVVEALELLRRLGTGSFKEDFLAIHDGLSLIRHGAPRLRLGVTVEGQGASFSYDIALVSLSYGFAIEREVLRACDPGKEPELVFERTRNELLVVGPEYRSRIDASLLARLEPSYPLLVAFGRTPPAAAIERVEKALSALDVHMPFEVTPAWLARSLGRVSETRQLRLLRGTSRLTRLGGNLIDVFQKLHNQPREHWEQTLNLVRMGLGEHVDQVLVDAPENAPPGTVGLWLKLRGSDARLSLHQLSDGQLAYLCFVALYRAGLDQRSALGFDEPELHLHPDLLARVTDFLAAMAREHPVLVATHSRRLLDRLGDDAARATVLCELDTERNRTLFSRPDAGGLAAWLERYEGLGGVLDAGLQRHVMQAPDPGLNSLGPP